MLYKLVMLGEGGVGKSCLSIQMCHNYFTKEYDPTIENSYRSQVTVDGNACMLHILDTAGQEEYIAMIDQHIQAGVGFALVYSITSRQSFEGVGRFYERIFRVKEIDVMDSNADYNSKNNEKEEVNAEYPIVMLGNKCDLERERVISTAEAKECSKKLKIPFFETSAKTRFNVEEAFHQLVREVNKWEAKQTKDDRFSGPSSSRKGKKKSKDGRSCILI